MCTRNARDTSRDTSEDTSRAIITCPRKGIAQQRSECLAKLRHVAGRRASGPAGQRARGPASRRASWPVGQGGGGHGRRCRDLRPFAARALPRPPGILHDPGTAGHVASPRHVISTYYWAASPSVTGLWITRRPPGCPASSIIRARVAAPRLHRRRRQRQKSTAPARPRASHRGSLGPLPRTALQTDSTATTLPSKA